MSPAQRSISASWCRSRASCTFRNADELREVAPLRAARTLPDRDRQSLPGAGAAPRQGQQPGLGATCGGQTGGGQAGRVGTRGRSDQREFRPLVPRSVLMMKNRALQISCTAFRSIIYCIVTVCFSTSNAGSFDDFFAPSELTTHPVWPTCWSADSTPMHATKAVKPPCCLPSARNRIGWSEVLAREPTARHQLALNSVGETALMLATLQWAVELSQRLIARGASISHRRMGNPLHCAATRTRRRRSSRCCWSAARRSRHDHPTASHGADDGGGLRQ